MKNRFSRIPFDLSVAAACEARRGRRLGRVLTGTRGDCTALRPALGRYDRRHIQPNVVGQAFIKINTSFFYCDYYRDDIDPETLERYHHVYIKSLKIALQ